MSRSLARNSTRQGAALVAAALLLLGTPAGALLHIDFEQPYYVHPGMQVWDFCLVEDQGLYHIFYHGIPMDAPLPSNAETIWRASSPDLIHWGEPVAVLETSDKPWEDNALWAPDVVQDPDTGLWWMAYTAVNQQNAQRIGMAWSRDLLHWEKVRENPVFEPDPEVFFYDPAAGAAECRDPYLYREGDTWYLLVTAKLQGVWGGQGALVRASSTDLLNWSTGEPFLANDGAVPYNSLESAQYLPQPDGSHHVFFHEHTGVGVSHIGGFAPEEWTFADRVHIDLGIAPEIDTFDGGQSYLFSRIGAYQEPDESTFSFVARIDTLDPRGGEAAPQVVRLPPLQRHFQSYAGNSCLGNPTFGDNPARRGEDPVGLVGNFYFGSREYFQGPLSGRGDAGREIGLTATGWLETAPFVVTGRSLHMLVGGTDNPDACFIALMDAATDTVIFRRSGHGHHTMIPWAWDLRDLVGREVYLRIEDSDVFGHINVDEIRESDEVVTMAGDGVTLPAAAPLLADRGPRPNPFNPATRLEFELAAPARVQARIHDLRGRLVWSSEVQAAPAGPGAVTWRGVDRQGARAAAGTYVYRLIADQRPVASGKVMLVP